MTRLSKDETLFIKEHLESLTVREFPTKTGLTDVEADLINTVLSLYEENELVLEDKASYKKFIQHLFDTLRSHKDEDGYCRLLLKEDDIAEILATLPEFPKTTKRSVVHED